MLREHRNLQTPLKQQFWQILPAVILLRLPLLLLPGAGRDEALYWYWAHHFELAYSPLLQIAIRLFEWLPLPDIWAIRLVSLVASGCSLWLLEQLLIRRKIKDVQRRWLLLALAVAPWQTYAGAILHPDMLLLATLLAFVYFSEKQGFTLAAISAGLAIWAKPSGILVIAIAILYWLVIDSNTSKLRIKRILLTLGTALPVAISANWQMVQGVLEFGKIGDQVSLLHVLPIQLLGIVVLGGPAMVYVAWRTITPFVSFFHRIFSEITQVQSLRWTLPMVISTAFFAAFGGAILITGQIKANWMLPAFVTLLLLWQNEFPIPWLKRLTLASLVLSIGFGLGFQLPGFAATIENRFPILGTSYSVQAGDHEARVSATSSWANRVQEYQALQPFAADVVQQWRANQPTQFPEWILSDDYGLATQLVFAWQQPQIPIFITGDLLFKHRLPENNSAIFKKPGLELTVLNESRINFPQLQEILTPIPLPHPYASGFVQLHFLSVN